MHHLPVDIPALLLSHKETGFPIEGCDREDGCGRTQGSVCYGRGSGISQTRQLLIPDPDGVRTLRAPQILVLPASPPPPHHAERALATHVEVTEGKYPQEKGHRLGFTPRAFRPGGLCCVLVPGWEEVSGLR